MMMNDNIFIRSHHKATDVQNIQNDYLEEKSEVDDRIEIWYDC